MQRVIECLTCACGARRLGLLQQLQRLVNIFLQYRLSNLLVVIPFDCSGLNENLCRIVFLRCLFQLEIRINLE